MSLKVNSDGKLIDCGGKLIENPACCEKEDGSTFLHPGCSCPAVDVDCESESITATLCGEPDPNDTSSPPNLYKEGYAYKKNGNYYSTPQSSSDKVHFTYSRNEDGDCTVSDEPACWFFFSGDFFLKRKREGSVSTDDIFVFNTGFQGSATAMLGSGCFTLSGSGSVTHVNECTLSWPPINTYTPTGTLSVSYDGSCDSPCESDPNSAGFEYSLPTATLVWKDEGEGWEDVVTATETTLRSCYGFSDTSSDQPVIFAAEANFGDFESEGEPLEKFSEPDSETDAIAAETPTAGTSCSSLFETRSTGFSLTKRTSQYTLNMSNLKSGTQYRVKPYIRRRTAVIGSYGAWEDVTTSWQTFTASGSTHSIGPVSLTHVQGYEYAITGAFVEPA